MCLSFVLPIRAFFVKKNGTAIIRSARALAGDTGQPKPLPNTAPHLPVVFRTKEFILQKVPS
jgi:hypothetical protein